MGWSYASLVAPAASLHRLPTRQSPTPPSLAPARLSCSAAPVPPARTSSPSPAPVRCPLPSLAHSHSGMPHGAPCNSRRGARQLCRAAAAEEYVFPDPIPDFAEAESDKFRNHMAEKLSKKDIFGSAAEEVVGICTGRKLAVEGWLLILFWTNSVLQPAKALSPTSSGQQVSTQKSSFIISKKAGSSTIQKIRKLTGFVHKPQMKYLGVHLKSGRILCQHTKPEKMMSKLEG